MGPRKWIQFGLFLLCVILSGASICAAQNSVSEPSSSVQEPAPSTLHGKSALPLLRIDSGAVPTDDDSSQVRGTMVLASADGQSSYLPGSAGTDNTIVLHPLSDGARSASRPSLSIELSTPADLLGAVGTKCAAERPSSLSACNKSRYFALLALEGSEPNLHSPPAYTQIGVDTRATEQEIGSTTDSAAARTSGRGSAFVIVSWNGKEQGLYRLVELSDDAGPDVEASSLSEQVQRKAQHQSVHPEAATPGVSTIENLGSVLASKVSAGLGWNVTTQNEWEFAAAAAAGATHVRFQCSWASTESQSAPPNNANTATKYTLQSDCVTALAFTKKYGLHPTVVAAYGPPFHQILSLTAPSGAAAGATSIAVQFASGVGGETLSSIRFPYDYLISSNGYTEISPNHSYAGTLITSITLIDSTHGLLHLASALNTAMPASSAITYTVNEALYPSAATGSPTDPSVLAFANYANFLATQIAAAGVTGEVELWNEPPWPDEAWDNRRDLYDSDPGVPGELSPGFPNWGFVAALQAYPPVAGVTYDWAGTNKSGDNSTLASGMLSTTGLLFNEPNAIVTFESMHPYGNNPEDAMWNEPCLQGTIQTYPAPPLSYWGCNTISGSGSNALEPTQLALAQQSRNSSYGIGHSITETGFASSQGDDAHKARFIIRQFLGFQADAISFLEFYRLYDTSSENFGFFNQTANTDGTYTPTPAYTAIAGLISDLAQINHAPVAPYSASTLTSVAGYSGTYPIDIVHLVGSRTGDTLNSDLVAVWQRSYTATNPGWGILASPTPAPVTLTIPAGTTAVAAIDLDTRATVPYQLVGQQVTFNVSDDPIEVLTEPIGLLTPTVAVAPGAINYGVASTTLQASISYTGAAAPSGAVTFIVDGGSAVEATCTQASTSLNCTATVFTASLAAGTHTIAAHIAAAGSYTSASATASLIVGVITPSVTVASEMVSYGTSSVTLQALISYTGASPPSGGISFTLDGGAPFQAACAGTTSPLSCTIPVSIISLPAGVHNITAALGASTDYLAASASGTLTIGALTPSVTVSSESISYGLPSATLQAEVSYGGPAAPTGALSFSVDGGMAIPSTCSGTASPLTCTALVATASLATGSHTVTASLTSSTNYTAASAFGTLTIGVLSPTVTVSSANISYGTASTTLQAQVAYTGPSAPTGATSFALDGGIPVPAVCTGTSSPLTCQAQASTANLAAGIHTVTATLAASRDYTAATGTGSLIVGVLTPTVTVTPVSISYGTSDTTLRAHIGYTGPTSPTGVSSFTLDNGTALPATCNGSTSPLSCSVVLATTNLPAGNHTIAFTVSPSTGYGTAFGSATLSVAVLASSISVIPHSIGYGTASTTVQAQISFNGPSAPTGVVGFTLDGGATQLGICTGTSSPLLCTAALSTSGLPAGAHTVSATVSASADYAAASASGALTVGVLTPTITIAPETISYGVSSTTVQAQVSYAGPSAPNSALSFTIDGGTALPAACSGAGSPLTCTAQVSTASFASGTHTVTASMSAGTDYAAASASGFLSVGLLTPNLTVSSASVSYGGASTTLQAQVRFAGPSAPTGMLSFSLDGGVAVAATCSGVSSPLTCTAVASTAALSAGTHILSATLAASTNYTAASASGTLLIGGLTPTIAVNAGSISYGTASATLQARISYAGPTAPTGTLSFTLDGGSAVPATCTGTSSPMSCSALANTASLGAGSHTITATLAASTDYATASGSTTLTVGVLTPAVTVTSESISYGAVDATLQAQVGFAGPSVPTGTLSFSLDGGGAFSATCTGTSSPITCTASAPAASLAAGTHTIAATLTASTNYAAATAAGSLTVGGVTPTVNVTPGAISYGTGTATLQAHVTYPGQVAPNGTFSFTLDGGSALPAICTGPSSPLTCTTLISTTSLSAGTHTVAATLTASTDNPAASGSSILTVNVVTPVLAVKPATISYGTSDTVIQAQVSFTGPSAPSGTLTFTLDGGTALPASCTGANSPLTCTAVLPSATLSAGTHSIAAALAGNVNYAAASASSTLTVSKLSPSITISPEFTSYGIANTTLQALVSYNGPTAPTGTVSFTLDDGLALQATCTGTSSPTTCTTVASTASLTAGLHTVSAALSASTDYTAVSGTGSLTVGVLTPTLSVVPESISYGLASTTLQAQIMYNGPSAPTGIVSFSLDGGGPIAATCTGAASPLNCTAAVPTANLSAGTHTIAAILSASANYTAASAAGSLNVGIITPTLSVSSGEVSYGTANTILKALVTYAGPAAPTGVLTFAVAGGTALSATCSGSRSPLICTTSFSTINLASGTHTIVATLAASVGYASATSASSLVVSKVAPTITMTPGSISYNTVSTTMQAQIGYTGPTAPTGSFGFTLDAGPILPASCSGAASPLTCTAVVSTASLAVGSHTIGASLTASTDYSAASASITLSVAADTTVTAISANSATISLGQNETFTASVKTAMNTTPTGNMSFFQNQTLLGTVPVTQGSATFSTSALPLGSDTVWAVYDGAAEYMPSLSISPAAVTVKSTDYTVVLSGSATATVAPGGSAEYKFLITPTQTIYPGDVTIAVAGLPSNMTYIASPATFASNAGQQIVILTVRTPVLTANNRPKLPGAVGPVLMGIFFLPLGAVVRRRGTSQRLRNCILPALLLAIATAGMLSQTGCGLPVGEPFQSYTITLNASAGNVQHSVAVNLQME